MSKKDDTDLDESKEDYNNKKNYNSTTTTTTTAASTNSVSDSVNDEESLRTNVDLNSKNENPTGSSNESTSSNSFDSDNQKGTIASESFVQEDAYSSTNPATANHGGLTGNYFCFDCGAIMTTLEDKHQHSLIEEERHKKPEDSEH